MAGRLSVRKPRDHAFDLVFYNMMADLIDASDSESEDDILEEGLICLHVIQTSRYLVDRSKVIKNFASFADLLPSYDDDRFRRTLRVGRKQFYKILELVKDHEVFESTHYPVAVQLAIALNRFGCNGNAASTMAVARDFGVGNGGTLNLFSKRVIAALLSIEVKFISWPSETERKQISKHLQSKLIPDCIGYVDGIHIRLNTAPRDDAISYFNRKGFYSLNLQIICDPFKRIRAYHIGQPGKVHDSNVYSLMSMYKAPQNYFTDNQYLIGDAAYKLTTTVLTPFRKTSGYTAQHEIFNNHISKNRIAVEHVSGGLKSRFASLRGLRMIVNRENGHQYACEWTVACMILYNMLLIEDPWTDLEEDSENEEDNREIDNIEHVLDEESGQVKRNELLDYILTSLG